jgi:hypothetical protein
MPLINDTEKDAENEDISHHWSNFFIFIACSNAKW